MYKKILILMIMLSLLVISCGKKPKLNNEEIKIIDKVKIEIEEMKKNPTQEKAQALFEKGKLQNKKLNPEIAKMYFESVSEYIPMSNYYIANYYRYPPRINKAKYEKYMKKASEQGIYKASLDLGQYYAQKGDKVSAINYFIKVVKQTNDPSWTGFAIKTYAKIENKKISNKKRKEIIKFLEEEGKRNYEMRVWLARFYTELEENYAEAEKIYIGMEKENYEKSEELLGDFYLEQKKYEKSEKWYLKGIEKRGRTWKLLNGLAILYKRTERYEEAKKIYEELLNSEDEFIRKRAAIDLEKIKKLMI